jgi:uncharacterized protein YndB with AHSA1/START domain
MEEAVQAKSYGRTDRTVTLTRRTSAPPEIVYDVLADLSSHAEWGGKRQYKMFRLLSVDAPPGSAKEGTVYTSVGTIPMMSARWENTNTVTQANRPHLFEITTEGRIKWPKGADGEGTFVNRFEITPDGTGSKVVYRSHQFRFLNPPWGLRYPVLRNMTYRINIPVWYGRGFRNMLKMAEERSRIGSAGS